MITWDAGEKDVAIMVTDSRPGLVNPSNAFVPFYTTKPQGTGMGLAITRSIVESHGGRIWATANQGVGATFHVTLPVETEAHS